MTAQRTLGEPILSMDNISLSFGGVNALSNISLHVREHEILAIIGPNGAGKSSLLNCINGVYHPSSGSVTYKGETRKQMRPHEAAASGIARTFQNIALFKGMSVLNNVMTGRTLKMHAGFLWQCLYVGKARNEEIAHRRKVEQIIDFLQIESIRKTPVGRLPYGLQKRVELGRALAAEPDLLLLDEPFNTLDADARETLAEGLRQRAQDGRINLLSAHDQALERDLGAEVVEVRGGHVGRRRG